MASSILTFQSDKKSGIAILNGMRPDVIQVGATALNKSDLNPTLSRFGEFWDLMDTVRKHGYIRAAMSVIGRSAVGAWWALRKNPDYSGRGAPDRHRRRLMDFYNMTSRDWTNIKDFQSFANKVMIGIMYLKYFGQVGYYIVKDAQGNPVGLDHLPGLIIPNVKSNGDFKTPAFVQYPDRNPTNKVEFKNPTDIVFITNPDWAGSPMGGSDIEALSSLTIPLDFYLQTAARDYMKNRDKPEVVYMVPNDLSPEGFESFVKEMDARQRGPENMGRNPIVVQGEFDFKELRPLPNSLPYQGSRETARDEELAVAGVSGSKLGLPSSNAADMKETRREFHETNMVPIFKTFELGLYEQVHVRTFNYPGWGFYFNSPDFLTAVERATVDMRLYGINAVTPNQIRYSRGWDARTDEYGDMYADQLAMAMEEEKQDPPEQDPNNPQGSPPEGREDRPDAPAETGEPTLDDQDPPRGDQHDDETRDAAIKELRSMKNFFIRRFKKGRSLRAYRSDVLAEDIQTMIADALQGVVSEQEIVELFDGLIRQVEEALSGKE